MQRRATLSQENKSSYYIKNQNRYNGQIGYNPANLIEINSINNLSSKSTCKESYRIDLFNARSVGTDEKRTEITETWLRPSDDEIKCADLTPSD